MKTYCEQIYGSVDNAKKALVDAMKKVRIKQGRSESYIDVICGFDRRPSKVTCKEYEADPSKLDRSTVFAFQLASMDSENPFDTRGTLTSFVNSRGLEKILERPLHGPESKCPDTIEIGVMILTIKLSQEIWPHQKSDELKAA